MKKSQKFLSKRKLLTAVCLFVLAGSRLEAKGQEYADQAAFAGSIREETLEEQIMAYYDAIADGDLARAGEIRGAEDRWRERCDAVLKEHGLEGYEEIRIVIYPFGERRVVIGSWKMKVAGFEEGLPGMGTWIAEKAPEGGWILYRDAYDGSADDEEMTRLWWELLDNKELTDWMYEINRKYYEVLEAEPGLIRWIETVKEALRDEGYRDGIYSGRDRYAVKPGDCLWKIAANELGDGMLWSELYEKNKEVIGEDPDLLLPGWELELLEK